MMPSSPTTTNQESTEDLLISTTKPAASISRISKSQSKTAILRHTIESITTTTQQLDINRLLSSTALGAIWSGVCIPYIYGTVEATFPGKATLQLVLIKMLVTCSILSTDGNYVTMFVRRFVSQYTTCQFGGASTSLKLEWWARPIESMQLFVAILKGCLKSCNREILEMVLDDLKIWPLYDLTCYSFIPPTWRPITTSIVSSGWAMYTSCVSAKEAEEEERDDEEHEQEELASSSRMKAIAASSKATTPSVVATAAADSTSQESKTPSLNNNDDDNATEHKESDKKFIVTPLMTTTKTTPFLRFYPSRAAAQAPTSEMTKRLIVVAGGTSCYDDSSNMSPSPATSDTTANMNTNYNQ